MAQTTRLCPRRISPAENTDGTLVAYRRIRAHVAAFVARHANWSTNWSSGPRKPIAIRNELRRKNFSAPETRAPRRPFAPGTHSTWMCGFLLRSLFHHRRCVLVWISKMRGSCPDTAMAFFLAVIHLEDFRHSGRIICGSSRGLIQISNWVRLGAVTQGGATQSVPVLPLRSQSRLSRG